MEKITAENRKEAKKLLKKGKIQEFFELFFSHVSISKFANGQGMEMETWTDGGVNMLVWLENEDNLLEDFKEFVENFDVEEEIDLHREGESYKRAFTLRQSLNDFEDYLKWLNKIVSIIEKAGF
ncbi:MAG: hypothetical protein [Bacteriophage sp.]|nr:MAG: hypothetical protein [Bacteriophage sp.]UWG15446.1 MAG: hypothetical protein [Bacteriophage sp.]UWI34496.1 MAG: hypothetical protein [Bacteriophage sp.]